MDVGMSRNVSILHNFQVNNYKEKTFPFHFFEVNDKNCISSDYPGKW